jgi:tripartite ATP-independent transporter DctM subunit
VIALVLVFVGLLIVGAPIAFALGLASIVYVMVETQLPLMVVFQRMFTSLDSFPFMAIPFFILAGALMNASGLADQIIAFSRALVGHLAGGLANVSIVASMLFGGVSGSAIADSSALGSILIPAMVKEGYHARFAAAVNATSSTMGIIIPPSIPMILAGVATSLSIRELFFGGLVPGLLVGVGLLIVTTIISRRRGYSRFARTPLLDMLRHTLRAIPAFMMVAIILGGILGGIFTATEASVVAVFYALLVGFLYRRLTFANLYKALVDTITSSAVVMVVIATAGVITWLLAYSRIPQALAANLGTAVQSPVLLLMILALAFVVAGTVLDVSPGVLVFGPILLPMVRVAGIDPIHFTVVMVFALAIGLTTPPVGTTMMISSHIAKVPVLLVARASIPYILMMLLILFALVLFPELILWAPRFLFRGG